MRLGTVCSSFSPSRLLKFISDFVNFAIGGLFFFSCRPFQSEGSLNFGGEETSLQIASHQSIRQTQLVISRNLACIWVAATERGF